MRSLLPPGLLALAILTLTPPMAAGSAGPQAWRFDGAVTVSRLSPPPASRWLRPVDRVRLEGGWPFGGLSALSVDGGSITALADTGTLVRMRRVAGPRWPADVRRLVRAPDDGRGKGARDTESLASAAGGGWWVGYEGTNELRHLSADFRRLLSRHCSPALDDLDTTSGLEALAALPDGRLLGIAEGVNGDGTAPAFLWTVSGGRIAREHALRFRPPEDYRATDAAALDNRRLLVLVRRFALPEGFTSRLMLVALTPSPGFGPEVLTGRTVADFGTALDNAEGLAVERRDGRTVVTILSDDNTSPLQRTILARWEWLGG